MRQLLGQPDAVDAGQIDSQQQQIHGMAGTHAQRLESAAGFEDSVLRAAQRTLDERPDLGRGVGYENDPGWHTATELLYPVAGRECNGSQVRVVGAGHAKQPAPRQVASQRNHPAQAERRAKQSRHSKRRFKQPRALSDVGPAGHLAGRAKAGHPARE